MISSFINTLKENYNPRGFYVAPIIILLSINTLTGQNSRELEQNKIRIRQEITLINQMLGETQKTADVSLNQLSILNNKITTRETLISNINSELSLMNARIQSLVDDTRQLENELEALKKSYARMIYFAHRNSNSYQRIMFIFSSRTFNQAYQRLRYLRQLARHRHLQAERITRAKTRQKELISGLEEERLGKQNLLAVQLQELTQLASEKQTQDKTIAQLRNRETELRQRLREQQRAERELQRAIERLLAEERKRSAEAAREQGRPVAEAFRLTPEELIISDQFAGNKGRLPWPLERGIITGHFGEQPHPVLPGIKIANNGIDISTTQGTIARAIFEGTVSRVVSIPGSHFAIIIRHGEYLSVYANIAEVFVRTGQRVNIRQELGVIATDPRDLRTHLRLEIWKGNSKQNPSEWIAKQR